MSETLMTIGTGDQDEQVTMTRREARYLLAAAWSEGRMTGRQELADSRPGTFVYGGGPWIARNPYREMDQEDA